MARRGALLLLVAAACRSVASAPADSAATTVPDAAVPAGGEGSAPVVPDAGTACAGTCDTPDAAVAACRAQRPPPSETCRPPLEPQPPVMPAFDGGIPGPCSEVRGLPPARSTSTWTYDRSGRVVRYIELDPDTGSGWWQDNTWDDCGRLTYSTHGVIDSPAHREIESDYGPEGLLVRTVDTSGSPCEQRFGYLFDEDGDVTTVYDPATSTPIERLERDAGTLTAMRGDITTNYDLLPDGGVLRLAFTGPYASREERFDEQGRPLSTFSENVSTGTSFVGQWTWDGPRLIEEFGAGLDSSDDVHYLYDGAGALVHEDHSSMRGAGSWNTEWTVDYTWPDAGVRLATTTAADGHVTHLEQTVFDGRGNALSVDVSDEPDFVWQRRLTRSFACFDAK